MTFHCDREEFGMASISERESREIEAANASGTTPVVFIHGLWLLPSSWANWADFFKQAGYAPLTPDWPDDPETVEEARGEPRRPCQQEAEAGCRLHGRRDRCAREEARRDGTLDRRIVRPDARRPWALGSHRCHRPGRVSRRPAAARLHAQGEWTFPVEPRYRGRAITLTFGQFTYGWTNALDEGEAKRLFQACHVAGSGIALAQMGNANLNPWTESKVDTKNPDRGPLLILDGEKDHTVPWAIANAAYKRQKHNPSVTEINKMPNRGHSLTIDHGWQEVAQTAPDFIKRFVPAKPS
jgi:pimeloyl-ACP methyl ester carboxylesterase